MLKLLLHVKRNTAVPLEVIKPKHLMEQVVIKLPAMPHVFSVAGNNLIIGIVPCKFHLFLYAFQGKDRVQVFKTVLLVLFRILREIPVRIFF